MLRRSRRRLPRSDWGSCGDGDVCREQEVVELGRECFKYGRRDTELQTHWKRSSTVAYAKRYTLLIAEDILDGTHPTTPYGCAAFAL